MMPMFALPRIRSIKLSNSVVFPAPGDRHHINEERTLLR